MGVRPVLALPSLNGLFAHPRSLTELALALACARPSVRPSTVLNAGRRQRLAAGLGRVFVCWRPFWMCLFLCRISYNSQLLIRYTSHFVLGWRSCDGHSYGCAIDTSADLDKQQNWCNIGTMMYLLLKVKA